MSHQTAIASIEALSGAITELADAAKRSSNTVASDICTAVANIIASVKHGSSAQRQLMDAASEVGFTPAYYAHTIRVGFEPKESASGLPLNSDGSVAA